MLLPFRHTQDSLSISRPAVALFIRSGPFTHNDVLWHEGEGTDVSMITAHGTDFLPPPRSWVKVDILKNRKQQGPGTAKDLVACKGNTPNSFSCVGWGEGEGSKVPVYRTAKAIFRGCCFQILAFNVKPMTNELFHNEDFVLEYLCTTISSWL